MKKPALLAALGLLVIAACSGQSDDNASSDSSSTGEMESAGANASVARESVAANDETVKDRSESNASVPERFRGLYAVDRKACAEDYNYNPAFQNVSVTANEVSFFETGGPVTDVNAAGDNVAITLRETVGDGEYVRAIYIALNGDGTVRYRAGKDDKVKQFVRC